MVNISSLGFQTVVDFCSAYPHSVGLITYFTVFFEAMAVIGVIVPGFIIMPAIGFLIGSNVIPAGSTFLYAVLGALTGDFLSYFLGIHFKSRIHRIWPFTRWPKLLVQGEKYFKLHGGKSIFLGRFIGPMRAIIPLVAGSLNMSWRRFSCASLPSAIIWAVGYMVPGILLGALSLELPPKIAAEFTLWALLLIIIVWLLWWLSNHFLKQLGRLGDRIVRRIWHYCRAHKTLHWGTVILADPREPEQHQQLSLFFMALLAMLLFLGILLIVISYGGISPIDSALYYLFRSLRNGTLDYIFIAITLLGDSTVLIAAAGLLLLYFWWRRYWYVGLHWGGALLLGGGIVGLTKLFLYIPRPGEVLYEKYASSFPSAHTALSLILYGFLAVLLARELPKAQKKIPYLISGALVTLIAISRLYLGVHWISDVVAAIFIGVAVLLVVTISYRRCPKSHYAGWKIGRVALSIFSVVWLILGAVKFRSQVQEYTLAWPKYELSLSSITAPQTTALPLYRLNRFGKPIEIFNVVWVGELATIKQSLVNQGWMAQLEKSDLPYIIAKFFESSLIYHLPLFPQLYHNKPPVLLLTKKRTANTILVLRLWDSDLKLHDSKLPLWLGSIRYYYPKAKVFSFTKDIVGEHSLDPITSFTTFLSPFKWQEQRCYLEAQAPFMEKLDGDGRMLIIQPKNS